MTPRLVWFWYDLVPAAGAFTLEPGSQSARNTWPGIACTIVGVWCDQGITDLHVRPDGQADATLFPGGAALGDIGGTLPLRARGGILPPFVSGTAAAALHLGLLLELAP